MRNWLLSTLVALASWIGATALAQSTPVTPEQQQAVQQVVQAQIDAFKADDAPRAFSFASDGIRSQFGSPQAFMDMVRSSYPVVYRPASVRFFNARHDGVLVLLPVQMSDAQGRDWLAIYRLEALRDGSWRIAGCVLAPGRAQST